MRFPFIDLHPFKGTQITFFPMGGHYLIARDFRGPDRENDGARLFFAKTSMESVRSPIRFLRRWDHSIAKNDVEARSDQHSEEGSEIEGKSQSDHTTQHLPPSPASCTKVIPKHVDFNHEDSTVTSSEVDRVLSIPSSLPGATPSPKEVLTHPPPEQRLLYKFLRNSLHFLQTLFTVPTVVVISSFIISVVQPLKGLFVLLPSSPRAPDGQPPLAFIFDTATFLGGASVPLGLICLGSALARLDVPRNKWAKLPIGSIMCLALGRLVLQPVLGVLIVRGLIHAGVISPDDKVLQFVCM